MENLQETSLKKFKINDIIANQHPVMLCWMVASFFLICSMYIYTSITL